MFWEKVDPILTDRLAAAVAAAYEVFAGYRLSGIITHCDCSVCMRNEDAVKLSSLALTDIPATLLAEYTNSAHGYDPVVIEPELKHFLPRYFDLIAACEPPSALGLETCLSRLGEAHYRDRWPAAEADAVDEFFDAFLEASLKQLRLIRWPVGLRLEFDISEVLIMVVLAGGDLERCLRTFETGGDLERCLRTFETGDDPAAAVHMASLRGDTEIVDGVVRLANAHLEDHPAAAQRIGEWLMRNQVTTRIEAAWFELDDPAYDGVLGLGTTQLQ